MQTLMGLLGRYNTLGAPLDRFFVNFTFDRKYKKEKFKKSKIQLAGIDEMHFSFHLKKNADLNGI